MEPRHRLRAVGLLPERSKVATEPNGRNRFLSALSQADLAALAPHLKDCLLEKGQSLHELGEPYEYIYFPHSGLVSLVAVMGNGETIETALVGRESAIALTAGLGSRIAVNRAVVQLPGSAARTTASRFAALVEQSPTLRDMTVRHGEALLAQVQQTVACNIMHDVESRLCKWLLQARERVGTDTLPLTHEFLGQMLGVRRSTVTLVARVLQSAGMIHYRRGNITIRDARALEEASCECFGLVRNQTQHLLRDPEFPSAKRLD
jgi:CRP-like cAMP-binding protein